MKRLSFRGAVLLTGAVLSLAFYAWLAWAIKW
jgi:uncharacterized membrane protein